MWTHPWLPPWSTIATFSGESYCSNGGSQFIKPSPYDIGIRARAEKIDLWTEINTKLDALIDDVGAATMPNIIKHRLIDKLEYAKELKDNAKEECEADNFDGATKKLGVAKSQVESFASMVKITRRITPEDKASFLADSAKIIEKIDELIEGTVEFSSEIAKSLNFTAEHTENAKAPENLSND